MEKSLRELLLKDLCSRLLYKTKCHFKYGTAEDDIVLKCIDDDVARFDYGYFGNFHAIIDPKYIKPYLRPMSSMTEEEEERKCAFLDDIEGGIEEAIPNYINWLNKKMFDYRGLIPMGLALPATEGMYH